MIGKSEMPLTCAFALCRTDYVKPSCGKCFNKIILFNNIFSNSATTQMRERYRKLHEHPTDYQHSFLDRPKDGQYLLFLRNEFG